MKPGDNKKLFGTDGIRGEAGKFPLDPPTIRVIGNSLARQLSERTAGRAPVIVIGRDTRESGEWIGQDLISGAQAAGAEVQSAGIITTPGVAFLMRALQADAGVVISASHNPFHDNGIKAFEPSGRKIDEQTETRIEADIAAAAAEGKVAADLGDRPIVVDEGSAELRVRYLDYLADEIGRSLSLDTFTIVLDCANGAAFEIAPRLFKRLGARVIAINNQPNGRNINLDCGSLHPETLQREVLSHRANLGVAFDGDADRALFVDANGKLIDGDATMWVMANYLKARGELKGDAVVATVMTNVGLEVAFRANGIRIVRTDVGDRYVLDELIRSGLTIGGEQSGHIIFPNLSLAGDGMITTLCLLRAMVDQGKSLAELTEGFQRYPQILVNVRVREKKPFAELAGVEPLANKIETELGDRGRLLLRYSGTESLARVMIEGESEIEIKRQANALAEVIRGELGA